MAQTILLGMGRYGCVISEVERRGKKATCEDEA